MFKTIIQKAKNNKKELNNTIWLVSDKFLKTAMLFIVNIFVVRYLGSEQYGYLNYAMAFISLFASFSFLGINQTLLRDILKDENQASKLIMNAIAIKIVASFIIGLLIVLAMMYKVDNQTIIVITMIGSISLIFQSFDHLTTWYQSKVLSKYVVIGGVISSVISSSTRLLLVYFEFNVEYFGAVVILETFIISMFLIYFYKKLNNKHIIDFKLIELSTIKSLISEGWPFMFAVAVNYWLIRIDQIMIGDIMGFKEVGIYSLAVKINEMFIILPGLILSSFAPKIYKIMENKEYKNNKNISLYIQLMVLFGLVLILFFIFFGELIFVYFYGVDFRSSSYYLSLLNVSLLIILWSSLRPIYIRTNGLKYYNLVGMLTGTIINIILNYMWIPEYGIVGACYATIISMLLINFIFDLIYKPAREMAKIQLSIFKIERN